MNGLPVKNWYQPVEIANYLSIHRRTIYRWIQDGKLRAVRFGSGNGTLRVPRESVEDLFYNSLGGDY